MNAALIVSALAAASIFGVLGYLLARNRTAAADADQRAEQRTIGEQLGKLNADLTSTRAGLQAKAAEVERLKAELSNGDDAGEKLRRELHESEKQLVALQAGEARLREQIQDLELRIAELAAENKALNERAVALEAVRKDADQKAEENLRLQKESFEALSNKLLETSREVLVDAAGSKLAEINKPVAEGLAQMDRQLKEFDRTRAATDATLRQEIKSLSEENVRNREQTRALVQALRKPQTKGQWGEMQLKRAVEVAGMLEHCDFNVQVHIPGEGSALRPDMIVHLAGGKHVVVDSKVSLEAFLEAVDCDDDAEASRLWAKHAKQLRQHIDALAAKEYFTKVAGSPEFVLMFVPGEAILQPAFEREPQLLEYAAAKNIIIVSPTSLIGSLKAIAYGWRQAILAENFQKVMDLGAELYQRLATMGGHIEKLGGSLDGAMKRYNDTIGCLESRVMVTARKMHDLKLVEKDLAPLEARSLRSRPLASPELIESAYDARTVRSLPVQSEPETA